VNDSLTGAWWVQGAQELDQLIARVSLAYPPLGACTAKQFSIEYNGAVSVLFRLDGAVAGQATYMGQNRVVTKQARGPSISELPRVTGRCRVENKQNSEVSRNWKAISWEPGADAPYTLTAEVADGCGYSGGSASELFTVNSITVDVLGAAK
jgi:hypothetical protein